MESENWRNKYRSNFDKFQKTEVSGISKKNSGKNLNCDGIS